MTKCSPELCDILHPSRASPIRSASCAAHGLHARIEFLVGSQSLKGFDTANDRHLLAGGMTGPNRYGLLLSASPLTRHANMLANKPSLLTGALIPPSIINSFVRSATSKYITIIQPIRIARQQTTNKHSNHSGRICMPANIGAEHPKTNASMREN